jgi:hypothetical protein
VGRLWCPEFIPNIEKFLAVAIFKMAATIPYKFNIVRFQRHFICGCGIVVAILKMATGRNFSMLGINSGHHYLPIYKILMITLFDFNEISYVGRLWWPELIPNIENFLLVSTIPHKFNIVQFQRNFIFIIIYPYIKFWWYRTMLNFCGHFENGDC